MTERREVQCSVGVIGAGIAGLTAAQSLLASGHVLWLVDKGRSVGGRLATRRIAGATLDHGAQFFTVRTDEFATTVRRAQDAGVVYEWCRGFGSRDGHPRYAVSGGMNRLAKHLAYGVDVSLGVEIESVAREARGWVARSGDVAFEADALVLTAPVPQSLALLDAGGVELGRPLRRRLDAVTYEPTVALLVVLDRPSRVPAPGGVQLDDSPFSFVADNRTKGVSGEPAVTLHVSHALSASQWENDPDVVKSELLEQARPWLGDAEVLKAQLKRWRYAQPSVPLDHEIETTEVGGAPLVFAGDAFAGSKVEGAFRSGRAAAAYLDPLPSKAS